MAIFLLEGEDMSSAELVIARETNIELECHLESWLENSPVALIRDEFILYIGRQPTAADDDRTIYPDLLAVDAEGNLVIVELKKGRAPREIMAQLLDYAAWANELSDAQIRERAETYFETSDRIQETTFDDAFRVRFEMPDTDEIPPLNRCLRLFIVAKEIPSQVTRLCRFLRTSYRIDVTCIEVSTFKTESGEVIVNTETIVGNDGFVAPCTQQQHPLSPSRWSGDIPVKEVVWKAVQEYTQNNRDVEFAIRDITELILSREPNFKRNTVGCQITADCVNSPARNNFSGNVDRYLKIERGKYRLYDRENDNME